MATGLTSFKDLPLPLQIGTIAAAAGVPGGWMVTSGLSTGIRVIAAIGIPLGILAIVLLYVLYWKGVKWRKARHAKPMEQQVLRNAGAGRQGISDPEQLARLDDLRKKFEEGIATFRSAGKSLYSLPWYVILGESGSGKTEAIRHCGIGFPPNLHDRYQGVGGTRNMNWWFTDYGVVLDTAGRLMFEEASSGGTREWKEFLAMLGRFRPNCPINGVLLVIPSTSLIRDSVEEIEKKASQIAQQFDVIQRTLDVRFPVYVVVTKSDLVNGFREFFDGVSDPHLQHQILGWSNPQELDKPYDPDFVDKYLEAMKTRLFQMRLTRIGELLGEDAGDQEKPATDALYAFPHAFEQLGPRLKRYLDLIFCVGSQWSCKPLFFRGIYFTSSMQEGAALDEDLAAALGVPVESLPTGPVWRRDRAYFLRDLFTNKVFREWGLVTRATNARKLYTRRRAALLACAGVGLFILLVLTVSGIWALRDTVGSLATVLEPAARPKSFLSGDPNRRDSLLLIDSGLGGYRYHGGEIVDLSEGNDVPLYQYYKDLTVRADNWRQRSARIPRVFRPAVKGARIDTRLQQAAAGVYAMGVLQPLFSAGAETMKSADWTKKNAEQTNEQVLRYLIELRAGRSLSENGLSSLMEYVLLHDPNDPSDPNDPNNTHRDHATVLAAPLATLYSGKQQPYKYFGEKNKTDVNTAIDAGIRSFNVYWGNLGELKAIADIVHCLTGGDLAGGLANPDSFGRLEQQFINDCDKVDPNISAWKRLGEDWGKLVAAKDRVDKARDGFDGSDSLQKRLEDSRERYFNRLNDSYDVLTKALGDSRGSDVKTDKWCESLESGRALAKKLGERDFTERLGTVDEQFWADGLYEKRFRMYEAVVHCLQQLRNDRSIANLDALRNALESTREGEDRQYDESYRVSEGRQAVRRAVLSWWLAEMTKQKLEEYVRDRSTSRPNDRFDPGVVTVVFSTWNHIKEHCQDAQTTEEYRSYACDYMNDCLTRRGPFMLEDEVRKLGSEVEVPKATDWTERRKQIEKMSNDPIKTYGKLVDVRDRIRAFLQPVEGYACGGDTTTQFEDAWKPLLDESRPFYRDQCRTMLTNWRNLPKDLQSARQSLLETTPGAFLGRYFVSSSSPSVASPNCFWRHLGVTSLQLLADAVTEDVKTKAGRIADCEKKFPLERNGVKDLNDVNVEGLYGIYRQLFPGKYAPDTIGGGQETKDEGIDAWLKRLREPGIPPSLVQDVNMLPPPGGEYTCRVIEDTITTNLRGQVRGITIRKGVGSIDCSNIGDTWEITESNAKPLTYDCSKDAVEVEFWRYRPDRARETIGRPNKYSGPWAWHRMLKERSAKYDGKTHTYVLEFDALVDKEKTVKVTMQIGFFKESDGSGKPFQISSWAP
ncbi:MAG: hypothetical protein JW955_15625 [Sedimentisphaerales bacterium]|nr:hypothetical protein [Sedimentisphaerales bacterium]